MKRFRISLASLLLFVPIVALSIALHRSRSEIARLRSQLDTVFPSPELDIAIQVERATANAGIPVDTTMIQYNPVGATYMVGFTYIDPKDGSPGSGTIKLRHERDGRYVGFIRSKPFLKSQADDNGEFGLVVTVVDGTLGFTPRPNAPELKQNGG
ncbi:hypothetical protein CA13_08970 [Planctomycetes bacterium CA13]|uniref:Uncharacterized protein n=1 Tax=Novipirellula herctigrandis TaxID=2527986 RepID=A0A5C5YWW0_9BACT|nr:hypothetical protein CA13_08970 [Planctomycetes bacterium CA13]